MADHIITRANRRLIDRASPAIELPDPFHGLSAFHRIHLLTMPPTWSERWKLCDPGLDNDDKRDVLLDILFERRRAFDHQVDLRRRQTHAQRIEHFYKTNQPFPITDHALDSTSLKALVKERQLADSRETEIRMAYYARRLQREQGDDEDQPTRKRGRSR